MVVMQYNLTEEKQNMFPYCSCGVTQVSSPILTQNGDITAVFLAGTSALV